MFTKKKDLVKEALELREELHRARLQLMTAEQENKALKAENLRLRAEVKLSRQWNNLMTYDGTPQKMEEEDDE